MSSFFIIGTKGMLGNCAYKFFKKKYKVFFTNEKIHQSNYKKLINKINKIKPKFVLNSVGRIKQKKFNKYDMYFINSYFPIELANNLNKSICLINPSTDCVFDGKNIKGYNIKNIPNALDEYGKSKIIAEQSQYLRENILIPRTSIIGFELTKKKHSLLEWALSNKNKKIAGFTNHYWNGITTLEWCQIINQLIQKKIKVQNKVFQIGCKKKISKYELLKLINEVFLNNNLKIEKIEKDFINRFLFPEVNASSIKKQLLNLKYFYE